MRASWRDEENVSSEDDEAPEDVDAYQSFGPISRKAELYKKIKLNAISS